MCFLRFWRDVISDNIIFKSVFYWINDESSFYMAKEDELKSYLSYLIRMAFRWVSFIVCHSSRYGWKDIRIIIFRFYRHFLLLVCSSPLIKSNYFVWPSAILLWQKFIKTNCLITRRLQLWILSFFLIDILLILSSILNKSSVMLNFSVDIFQMFLFSNLFEPRASNAVKLVDDWISKKVALCHCFNAVFGYSYFKLFLAMKKN